MQVFRNCFWALLFLPILSYSQKEDRPNILWIVSEDNDTFLGCYGDKYANTPNIDRFAKSSILFLNAFSTAPVCDPSRFTLITGMYPPSTGTENMRSEYPVPSFIKFFPRFLREQGYYTTNNAKKGYNTVDQPEAWDESSNKATYQNRKEGQPFFAVFNLMTTHESSIFSNATIRKVMPNYSKLNPAINGPEPALVHDPEKAHIPDYLPKTEAMKHDWALYYDRITQMDAQVGKLLHELDSLGLSENTIVFYYSDNGGVLGRSKRFIYESGLHIPLIVHFPKKYQHLAPNQPGTKTDRLVTFADFGPTILSLAGVAPPSYIQGKSFAGKFKSKEENDVAFGFRNRMDERFDLIRSVRDKQYRYVRSYQPYRIYGQNVQFLWLANSMQSWEDEFKAGRLNEVQSRFFKEKPTEELYDVQKDPDNIHNLATDPQYETILKKLRQKNRDLLIEINDVGFIPEADVLEISKSTPLYDYARSGKYDIRKVLPVAEAASLRDKKQLPYLIEKTKDKDDVVRYWAVTGLLALSKNAVTAKPVLFRLLNDSKKTNQIVAAEALLKIGEEKTGYNKLYTIIRDENVMIRLQALNALQNADAQHIEPVKDALEQIVKDNASEYDVKAAEYLLEKIGIKQNHVYNF